MTIVPASRPQLDRAGVTTILRARPVDVGRPVLLGVRGYYRDTMGAAGRNDIGLFDDAMFLLSPSYFGAFNANTDPSREHPGVATLQPGVWLYTLGVHGISRAPEKRYQALVQAADVTVSRSPDATHPTRWLDKGRFGINIHRGGQSTTSSEGCQTIHRPQWEEFIGLVQRELLRAGRRHLEYVLIEGLP